MEEQAWFVFAHPVGSGHVAIPCASEEAGRRKMQDYAFKGATFPFTVPLLRTRVCTREALQSEGDGDLHAEAKLSGER